MPICSRFGRDEFSVRQLRTTARAREARFGDRMNVLLSTKRRRVHDVGPLIISNGFEGKFKWHWLVEEVEVKLPLRLLSLVCTYTNTRTKSKAVIIKLV